MVSFVWNLITQQNQRGEEILLNGLKLLNLENIAFIHQIQSRLEKNNC